MFVNDGILYIYEELNFNQQCTRFKIFKYLLIGDRPETHKETRTNDASGTQTEYRKPLLQQV